MLFVANPAYILLFYTCYSTDLLCSLNLYDMQCSNSFLFCMCMISHWLYKAFYRTVWSETQVCHMVTTRFPQRENLWELSIKTWVHFTVLIDGHLLGNSSDAFRNPPRIVPMFPVSWNLFVCSCRHLNFQSMKEFCPQDDKLGDLALAWALGDLPEKIHK